MMKQTPSKDTSYKSLTEFTTSLGENQIRVISKPGLPYWDAINPACQLILRNFQPAPNIRMLLLGGGHGALAVWLAQQLHKGELWVYDTNFLALMLTKKTLNINHITNYHIYPDISIPSISQVPIDSVVIILPKGRKLFQRWLIQSLNMLKIGGSLYIVGDKNLGIKSAIKDANGLLGNGAVLGYKKSHRIAVFEKKLNTGPKPNWYIEPGIAPGTWFEFPIRLKEETLNMLSLPGVFSYDRLDEGTALLLNQIPYLHGASVLDLGCGYGIIGIAAHKAGAHKIDLIDVNLLAIASAKINIKNLGIVNVQIIPSDVTSGVEDRHYDYVITNPPFHTGRSVDFIVSQAFITQSHERLTLGGHLLLVANKFIDYGAKLQAIYSRVDIIVESNKFRVFRAQK
jgi:16S rRNA (guanine1207-N2)-methyltransferase